MKFKATTFIVTIGLLLFNASCVSKNNSSSDINISSSSDLIYTTSTLESSIEFSTSISSPQIISSSSLTSKPTSREKISIYLNPSVQTKNMYINNLGSEAENMRDIAELMYKELKLVSYIDIEANIAKMDFLYLNLLIKAIQERDTSTLHYIQMQVVDKEQKYILKVQIKLLPQQCMKVF